VVARDVTVALATSRRYVGAAPIAEALDLHAPLILYDGALTLLHPSRSILARTPLRRALARAAVEVLARHDLRPVVQYAGVREERLFVGPTAATARYERGYLDRFADQLTVAPLAALSEQAPALLRITAFGPLDDLRRAAQDLVSLPCGWQLLAAGNYGSAELSVFARAASKGAAVRRLAARLRIPSRATLAIGDGVNDISMLSAAGLGVAMGNAASQVRAVAGATTTSNAEEGVAAALERFILCADE
jgi:Cof subfamily protein (haloacid dehalogenase superfamily)